MTSLTLITLLPLIAGVLIVASQSTRHARGFALISNLASLWLALKLWKNFDGGSGALQFVEQHDWIKSLGVNYFVGVDGLGLLMVLLTTIVTLLAVLASWQVEKNPPLFFGLVLFLQAGLYGTFTAQNFFHWFLFWELSLIPAFFLVRLWGGPQRLAAATQFFVYTMVGSVAMLLAFLAIFLATKTADAPGVFDFPRLAEVARSGELAQKLSDNFTWKLFGHAFEAKTMVLIIFAAALLGFAVKVPMMPFHTWLPATYTEAPTGVTMLLTGAMSKMGVYGFVRILLPIFSHQMSGERVRNTLLLLAVATIVFSAAAAFAQRDLKRMLAYSSINHLGYCLLGVFAIAGGSAEPAFATERAAALNGVFLQMFNHGLTAATLFWFVALIERRSNGLRGLDDFGGLRKVAPIFCGFMGIALFSSLGLPGLNGFVGEFLIFKGAFPLAPWATGLSVIGLLVTAIFILTILQRVFNGPLNEKWAHWPDLTIGEMALVIVPIALMFLLGLWPRLVLDVVNSTAVQMAEQLKF